jgi:monoamine oxidase
VTETSITRRRFVGAAAATGAAGAAGAAAALPRSADATAQAKGRRKRTVDVAVVGAGFAGLTAARKIHQAGHTVAVVEARNRVGGRAVNLELPGGEVSERGATFVGPTQNRIKNLAKAMNVDTFPTFDTGDNVYLSGGKRLQYSDTGPTGTAPPDPAILPDLAKTVGRLDTMSTSVPVDAPWSAPQAVDWDSMTLESWFVENGFSADFRRLASFATRPIFGCEPRNISLLFVLFYIAASGNEKNLGTFERNFNTRGGAQQDRFVGGSQLVAERVAKKLGNRVILGSPVRAIVRSSSRVRVDSDEATVYAKRVIVAIPPALASRIAYDPIMPSDRDQLTQRIAQGALTKVTAVYKKPFWRDKGLNGSSVSTDGLISATFDDSPPGGKPGVIFGFVGGDNARRYGYMDKRSARRAVLRELAQILDDDRAKDTIAYYDTKWAAKQWTRGCPVGLPSTGTLVEYGPALRRPVDTIHWAGTETSTYWNGYMDGAVRSGERAAAEVLAAL